MATFPITATVDEIDRLKVHFDTDRPEGALFWSWDHDGGHLQAPADASFRFPVPGDYTVTASAENGDTGTVDVTVPGASDGGGGGAGATITSITPNNGPAAGGTFVTIAGTGLDAVAGAKLQSHALTGFSAIGATERTGMTPAMAVGLAADLILTDAGGNAVAAMANAFMPL